MSSDTVTAMPQSCPDSTSIDCGRLTYKIDPSPKLLTLSRDDKLERDIIPFAVNTSYGDVNWHPSMKEVIWRKDNAVPVSTPGNGGYALPIFGPTPDVAWAALRRGGTDDFSITRKKKLHASSSNIATRSDIVVTNMYTNT